MKTALLACVLSFAGASPALADCKSDLGAISTDERSPRIYPQVNLLAENDMFNGKNDRNYTSGLQIGASAPFVVHPCFELALDSLISHARGRAWAFGLNFTNMIFTPTDLTRNPPDPNDRPYAGVTAMTLDGFSTDARPWDLRQTLIHFDEIGVSLGEIGPNSGSAELQRWWHKSVLHIGVPAGWDDQEADAALVEFTYQHSDLHRMAEGPADRQAPPHAQTSLDWSLSYGFGAGTFLDYAHVGLSGRLGYNVGEDYGPPRIDPSMHGAGYWNPDPALPYFGGYVFTGVDQRYIAYDHTLDAHPSLVERRDWIGDAECGWVAHIGGMRLAGVYIWRDRQFRTQRQPDSFGAYSVTFSLCGSCYLPWDREGRMRRMF
jgi:hypothetical protein